MISLEKWMILAPFLKLPKNVGYLGKFIGAKGFKKLPKEQKIANSGHTVGEQSGGNISWSVPISVTRLGDLLDFGQVFKAFGNNNKFAQISQFLSQFL